MIARCRTQALHAVCSLLQIDTILYRSWKTEGNILLKNYDFMVIFNFFIIYMISDFQSLQRLIGKDMVKIKMLSSHLLPIYSICSCNCMIYWIWFSRDLENYQGLSLLLRWITQTPSVINCLLLDIINVARNQECILARRVHWEMIISMQVLFRYFM